MPRKKIMSDHYDNWSDHESIQSFSTAPAQPAADSVASFAVDPARVPHRALQALRKAGMQVFERTRSRTQILSFGQSEGWAPPDGLCASSLLPAGQTVAGPPPQSPRDSTGDLSNQPGTPAPSRTAVRIAYAGQDGGRSIGCGHSGHAGSQYAPGLAPDRIGCRLGTGGL